jgi:hypothetical protein
MAASTPSTACYSYYGMHAAGYVSWLGKSSFLITTAVLDTYINRLWM